jgi:hypothetical protein
MTKPGVPSFGEASVRERCDLPPIRHDPVAHVSKPGLISLQICFCAPRHCDVHAEMEHRRARDRVPRGFQVELADLNTSA